MNTYFQKFYTPLVCPLLCKINLKMSSRHEISSHVLFLNQNEQRGPRHGGQRRFLYNLDLKPDAAPSPHHRFSHGGGSPTPICKPPRGFPHPLSLSLLDACWTWKLTQITLWCGGGVVVGRVAVIILGCIDIGVLF